MDGWGQSYLFMKENFDDAKGVIRSSKLEKNRQYNG
jgi:hypothetical protein